MPESKENSKTPVYDSLSARHRLFVDYYIDLNKANFNATEAARLAGYKESSARQQGFRLLKNVDILDAIKEKLDEAAMGPSEALKRLSLIASGTVDPFLSVSEKGSVFVDLGTEEAIDNYHLIKKIKQTKTITRGKDDYEKEEVRTEFELHDAKSALVDILKIHGKFSERVDQFNHNIDWSKLSDEQIERLSNGEDPRNVLATQG